MFSISSFDISSLRNVEDWLLEVGSQEKSLLDANDILQRIALN